MEEIKIFTEYIKLDQALKLSGISISGSEAKEMILDGMVLVNNEVELRRGRKLRVGDVLSIDKKEYIIK